MIDGRFASGGEVAIDERRRIVLTADRSPDGAAGITPGVSVVGMGPQRWRWTIPFSGQPASLVPPPGGGGLAVLAPQVPSGLDIDARRGLAVTANSGTDTVTVASVRARRTTARDLVEVGDHPFGVAADEGAGEAYVAMYGAGRIDAIDLRRRRVTRTIDGLVAPTKLALDDETGTLYVGNADRTGARHTITVVDARDGRVRARVAVDPNSRPTLDREARLLYAASFATGRIAVIDLSTTRIERWIETGSTPHGIAIERRANVLYAPNLLANSVTVIDRRSLAVLGTVPVAAAPLGIAVDERTGWAYVSSRDASTLTALRLHR